MSVHGPWRLIRLPVGSDRGRRFHSRPVHPAEETKRTLEAMQNAIRVLALGIDFRRFSRFERFTPEVLSHHTGDVALHQHFRQAAM